MNAERRVETGERPTLKTISRLSGLAVTTVSRALGDAPDISRETKKRVREIAREIGYVPNRAGVRLRTGRTNVIALVLPTEDEVMNMTPRLIASVAGALADTPYHLIVVPELPHQTVMDPVRYIVETGSADAIIINRIEPEDQRVAYLREKGFPFVTHGRTVWKDRHAWFDFDNVAFGRLAVETLAARGRRNLLMFAPPLDQAYGQDIVNGAVAAAEAQGVRLILSDVTSDDMREDVARELDEALARLPELDGLISASPHAAMAAAGVVEARGREVGESFDIYAKETFPILGMFREGILSLSENIETAGRFLAEAAIHEVATKGTAPMQKLDRPGDPASA